MTAVVNHHLSLVEQPADPLLQYYNRIFEWSTTIDSATGELRLQLGETVDALLIRAGFAAEVNKFLVRHMFRVPIIVMPGSPEDWVFVTQQRTTMRMSVWEDLVRIQVGWKRRGDTIPLPPLDNIDDGLRWFQRPEQQAELPPWSAVICAARSASTLLGRGD